MLRIASIEFVNAADLNGVRELWHVLRGVMCITSSVPCPARRFSRLGGLRGKGRRGKELNPPRTDCPSTVLKTAATTRHAALSVDRFVEIGRGVNSMDENMLRKWGERGVLWCFREIP